MKIERVSLVVVLVVLGVVWVGAQKYTPVVLMHGITADNGTMTHAVELLRKHFPGIYVVAPNLGGWYDSVMRNMDHQVETLCHELKSDPHLRGGINLIGFSQGGPITRGYLERCNDPPVKNYIGWVSPQGGVFGCPQAGHIRYLNWTLDEIADCCVYDSWVQNMVSFAGYWRDPYAEATYEKQCLYLPDIDNSRPHKNSTYKKNVLSLKNFVMSYSTIDDTLIPRETGWFGVYAPNSVHSDMTR
eukprot:TRINITY_DN7513_c0_g1_i2.p1 TRINITY_DN7513_c0_g1~~TRINITY_DN7513_c0_g1_i2.p1  ORF type:complete len:244 (-),score=42.35 TRINITY_DN7513_c0_g1_i2:101-832(-)